MKGEDEGEYKSDVGGRKEVELMVKSRGSIVIKI